MLNGNDYNLRDLNGLKDFQLASSSGQSGDKNSSDKQVYISLQNDAASSHLDTTMENNYHKREWIQKVNLEIIEGNIEDKSTPKCVSKLHFGDEQLFCSTRKWTLDISNWQ